MNWPTQSGQFLLLPEFDGGSFKRIIESDFRLVDCEILHEPDDKKQKINTCNRTHDHFSFQLKVVAKANNHQQTGKSETKKVDRWKPMIGNLKNKKWNVGEKKQLHQAPER